MRGVLSPWFSNSRLCREEVSHARARKRTEEYGLREILPKQKGGREVPFLFNGKWKYQYA